MGSGFDSVVAQRNGKTGGAAGKGSAPKTGFDRTVQARRSGNLDANGIPVVGGGDLANLPSWAKPGHKRGFLDKVARVTGAEFVGNLGRDVGETAIGVVPGLYHVGKASAQGYLSAFDLLTGNEAGARRNARPVGDLLHGLKKQYVDYYGHNQLSHLYNHPLQPILDALTIADLGSTAGVKAGLLKGDRASIVTRSPRAIAEGTGPVHVELSSVKPIVRARELLAHKLRTRTYTGELGGRVAGEVKAYGKGVHTEANQHALGRLAHYLPYLKATKRLTDNERTALQIRSLDIHPDDLAEVWKGTPDAKLLTPRVRQLILEPSKRMVRAEPEARALSHAGEQLGLEHGFLAERTVSVAKPPPSLVRLRSAVAQAEKVHGTAVARAEKATQELVGKNPELAKLGKVAAGPGLERVLKSYRITKPAERGAPVTEQAARARLNLLEKKHAKFHEQARVQLFGDKLSPGDLAEQRFRNVEKGKALKQQSGAANKSTHGTYKHRIRKTVKQEQLDEAIRHIDAEIQKNPDAPHVKAYLAEESQIAALRDALNPLPGDKVDMAAIQKILGSAGKPAERQLVARTVQGPGRVIAGKGAARADRLGGHLSVLRDKLERAEARFASSRKPDRVGGTVQRVELPKRAASEALGRPVRELHGQPYYVPHVAEQTVEVNPLGGRGGGKAEPRRLASTKRNEGTLFLRGKLSLRPDVLGPEFLRRVKYVKYQEIHKALVDGAIKTTMQELERNYDGKLPKGYEYIRRTAADRIPGSMRGESDIPINLQKIVPNAEDLHDSQLAEGFSTTDPAEAHVGPKGELYIVPKQLVKAATGEFTRISDFQRAFIQRPLAVWRAVVLGLRVGFLTNNLIGNSIMYAVRTAGAGAFRDLFKSILEQHGANVAKKVLDNAATPPALRQSLYEEFFPEQVAGTFGRTQSPANSTFGAAATKAERVARDVTSAIPNVTSQVAEVGFRRALIRHYIRHSPEFKAVYRALPKESRTFEDAARQVLSGKGGKPYQRYISKQVNQSLGNYLGLSPVERNVLRNTLPFYAWYKAIVVTTAHLAVDAPLRANILGQIGQIGKQWSEDQLGQVPSFLAGAIPLGNGPHGTRRVLGTQGLNPYATLEQLRKGSSSDISSLGLNPFFAGILDTYAQAKQQNFKVSGPAVFGKTIVNIAKNLPLSQLVEPNPPSRLYPTRGRRTTSLSYLGFPVKEYDPNVAAQQAREGR